MPSVGQMATNLFRSVKAFAKSGGKLASKEVRTERKAICVACEHWTGFQCRKCGCTGLKLYAAAMECPIGKWLAVTAPPVPSEPQSKAD